MRIGFISLGCPKNLVDSEVMMGMLEASGHQLTNDPSKAEAIVVNTCSFINSAKQESINAILDMAEYKKVGNARRLVVTGCLVERYRAEILKRIPEVDAVLGTNEIEGIVAHCEDKHEGVLSTAEPYLYHDLTPRVRATAPYMAYMKVNEGCDHPCTFCIIPKFRGRFRSRRFESVIREATELFRQGVREINLVGQDTTSYGDDFGLDDGLAILLDRLAHVKNAGWIRFLYVYPNRVTQKLLDTVAEHQSICNYIDIPLQHASANVLKRMKRGGSGDIFLRLLERIRKTIPGVAIRTSFIVGFPGETDHDFDELLQFSEAAQFDRVGVFGYSDDETSESFHLPDKISARKIYNRRRRLMGLQRKISRKLNRRLIGQRFQILIQGPSAESEFVWQGRLATQAEEIDGKTYLVDFADGIPKPGDFGEVRITETGDYDLIGILEKVYPRTEICEQGSVTLQSRALPVIQ